jgi:hypothetical protein
VSRRNVQAEWLDELPPAQVEAQASRRDLRRINRLMGHLSFFEKVWSQTGADRWCTRMVDLGGGDGTLLLGLLRRLPTKPRFVVLLDRQPVISGKTLGAIERLGCQVQVEAVDAFDWLGQSAAIPGTFILTNLFLHHFEQEALGRLLGLIRGQCQGFVACEPRRGFQGLCGSYLLGLIGCNAVTRHDAVISVRAGFRGDDLSLLWPPDGAWEVRERPAGLFTHLFWAHTKK